VGVSIGTRLGPYEILSPLGAGGMGEVYRARDTKLNRDVAIKILPEAFQIDSSRVARFTREAQALASLNHPNVAAIYGVEDSNGVRALVLELVDGPTLADRIRLGPIPLEETLEIARQLAGALAAAHDAGVIHRDLKPSNIKVRDDGTTKVLDFGLAKLVDPVGGNEISVASAAGSPTVTSPAMMTGIGLILGTAAYMSPEQAKGRPADKRSDIWAFGCVLYEMLTGKRAFEGQDVNDTLAAVLRSQPDLSALPPDLPESVPQVVSGCLEKDRSKRFGDIAIVQFLLTTPMVAAGPGSRTESKVRSRWQRAAVLLGAVALGAAVVRVADHYTRSPALALPVTRFTLRLPEGQRFTNPGRSVVALSPDGTRVAYVANQRLYVKTMWDSEPVPLIAPPLRGGVTTPVFSPESQSIAYWADGTVYKIAVTGGTPVRLFDVDIPYGMSWTGNSLLLGSTRGVLRAPDSGGPPEVVVPIKNNETAHSPQLLPDGRSILFTLATGMDIERWDLAEIVVQRVGANERKTVIKGGADAHYLTNGSIAYAVSGALFAVPFNLRTMDVVGPATQVLSGLSRAGAGQTGIAQFSVSSAGSLAYVPGPSATLQGAGELALLDRKGNVQPLKFPPRSFQAPRFCPTNAQQLAVGIDDKPEANIWIYDITLAHAPRQLTLGGRNRFPAWTRDGTRIAFQSDREGDHGIFWQRADGSGPAERLTRPENGQSQIPLAWSPDGETLLISTRIDTRSATLQQLTLHDKKVMTVAGVTSVFEIQGGLSPDGHWIAYAVTGLPGQALGGLFVRPFPVTDVVHRIGFGNSPFWAPVGKSLYYVSAPGVDSFTLVDIATEPTFEVSEPTTVLRPVITGGGANLPRAYDASPDNQHLIVITVQASAGSPATPQIQFVLNWFDELKNRVAGNSPRR
jgi:serine/threonine-protein kinase